MKDWSAKVAIGVATVVWVCLWSAPAGAVCPAGPVEHAISFSTAGGACNGVLPSEPLTDGGNGTITGGSGCSQCCKNFLSCNPLSRSCFEPYPGMACDPLAAAGAPCGWELECVDGSCLDLSNPLENGAFCQDSRQCGSLNCAPPSPAYRMAPARTMAASNASTCVPPAEASNSSCGGPFGCPARTWCEPKSNTCVAPLPVGAECSEGSGVEAPNWVCAGGSGCLRLNGTAWRCVGYYSQKAGNPCSPEAWWNCQYGLACVEGPNGSYACGSQPENPLKTSCSAFPFSSADLARCPVGAACDCYATDANKTAQCAIVVNTNCQAQMANLNACLFKNACPHDPVQLLGGNPSPFVGSVLPGSCVDQHCASFHASLIYCQNDALTTSKSPAYTPTLGPNHYQAPAPKLEDWQIALMIVAGSDAFIIFLILSFSYLRRDVM